MVLTGLWMTLAVYGCLANGGVRAYFLPMDLERSVSADPLRMDADGPPEEQPMCHATTIVDSWECLSYENPKAAHPNFGPVRNIQFRNVSRRQFRKLKRLYRFCSGGGSKVRYTPSPTLLDFMSPLIQATWGHCFRPEDERGPAPLFYQCYGFLLDVLWLNHQCRRRRKDRWLRPWTNFLQKRKQATRDLCITFSTPDSRSTYEALKKTTTLVSNEFSMNNNYAAHDHIQPGDVILVFHDNSGKFDAYTVWLDHVAMYIDGGILLEKSGSGDTTPFRFVDYATFDKSWGLPGVFRTQVRRPKRTIDVVRDLTLHSKYSLPQVEQQVRQRFSEKNDYVLPGRPDELCGSTDDELKDSLFFTKVLRTSEPFQFDVDGRAKLPHEFFKADHE